VPVVIITVGALLLLGGRVAWMLTSPGRSGDTAEFSVQAPRGCSHSRRVAYGMIPPYRTGATRTDEPEYGASTIMPPPR
jgi:hypothetical protein